MNILEKIVAFKKEDVNKRKIDFPLSSLQGSEFYKRVPVSFYDALRKSGPSIIGEFKRKSPSKGIINSQSDPDDVARGYEDGGVAAMSILTDNEFFGGTNQDLMAVARIAKIPLLRKEFIVDEYQIIESKSIGASAILLIASVLTKKEVSNFSRLATESGLDILFEIHTADELDKLSDYIKIIGVNNRNLNNFDVSISNAVDIINSLPADCIRVAESGFNTVDEVALLHGSGYNSFLIGERFMRSANPGASAKKFIKELNSKINGVEN